MHDVPFFLEARIRQALAHLGEVARVKGLVHAFEIELFAAVRDVEELLGPALPSSEVDRTGAGTVDGKQRAQQLLTKLDALLAQLEAAPKRAGAASATGPVGRAGRGDPAKRWR